MHRQITSRAMTAFCEPKLHKARGFGVAGARLGLRSLGLILVAASPTWLRGYDVVTHGHRAQQKRLVVTWVHLGI